MGDWDALDTRLKTLGETPGGTSAPASDWDDLDVRLKTLGETPTAPKKSTPPADVMDFSGVIPPEEFELSFETPGPIERRDSRTDFAQRGYNRAQQRVGAGETKYEDLLEETRQLGYETPTADKERSHERTTRRDQLRLERAQQEERIATLPTLESRIKKGWEDYSGIIPKDADVGTTILLENAEEGKPTLEKLKHLESLTPEQFLEQYPAVHPQYVGSVKAYKVGELAFELGLQKEQPKFREEWFTEPEAADMDKGPGWLMKGAMAVDSLGRGMTGAVAGGITGVQTLAPETQLTKEEFFNERDVFTPSAAGGGGMHTGRGVSSFAGRDPSAIWETVKDDPAKLFNIPEEMLRGAKEGFGTLRAMPITDKAVAMRNNYSHQAIQHRFNEMAEQDGPFAEYLLERMSNPGEYVDASNEEYETRYRAFLGKIEKDTGELIRNDDPVMATMMNHPLMMQLAGEIILDPLTWYSPSKLTKLARAKVPQLDKLMVSMQTKASKSAAAKLLTFAPEAGEMRALSERARLTGDTAGSAKALEMADLMEFERLAGAPTAKRVVKKKLKGQALARAAEKELAGEVASELTEDMLEELADPELILRQRVTNFLAEGEKRGFVKQLTKVPKVGKGAPPTKAAGLRADKLAELAEETGIDWVVPKGKAFAEFQNTAIPAGFIESLELGEKMGHKGGDWLRIAAAGASGFQRVWAMARTTARFNFAPRNATSALFFGALHSPGKALNPQVWNRASEIVWDGFVQNYGSKSMKANVLARRADPFILPSGVTTTRGEMFDLMEDLGWMKLNEVDVGDISKLVGELEEGTAKRTLQKGLDIADIASKSVPGRTLKTLFEGSSQASESFQHLGVAMLAMTDIKMMKDPVAKARYLREIGEFSTDYRRMGVFQQKVAKNAIPFYSWSEAISKLTLTRLYKDPSFMLTVHKIMNVYKNASPLQVPEEQLPGYLRNQAYGSSNPTHTLNTMIKEFGVNGQLPPSGTKEHFAMVTQIPWAGSINLVQQLLGGKLDPDAPILESITPILMTVRYLTAEREDREQIRREINPVAPQIKTTEILHDLWQMRQRLESDPEGAAQLQLKAIREFGPYWPIVQGSLFMAGRTRIPDLRNQVETWAKTAAGTLLSPHPSNPARDLGQ